MSRKSGIKQTLEYLFKDDKKLSDAQHLSFIIRKNIRTKTLEKNIKEFEHNETLRTYKRKDGVKLYHTVISFNNKDREHITEKTLRDISKQYMKLQGNDNMYLGTAHFDQDHIHLHFAVSGTKYMTGKANRLTKQDFKELKLSMDVFQKKHYPELTNSLPNHNKQTKDYQQNPNTRNSQKEVLQKALEGTFANARSVDEFLNEIKKLGHEPYYRGDKLTGIKYDGDRKFRLNRLGYDMKKLNELEQKSAIEKQQLDELESLRNN